MDVELRHLRALVAIGDEGTITGAAARLHITQPALSRTLHQLEQRLGNRLADRSTRHLELTPAGRQLYDEARAILAHVDAALAEAAAGPRPLRLGYTWAAFGPYTTPLLRSWRRDHPRVPVEVHRLDERTAGLSRGLVDVAVVRTAPSDPRVRFEALYEEEPLAALPEGHPLCGRDRLALTELFDQTIAVCPLTGTTRADLWPPERRPRASVEVRNVDEWLTVIAAGDAVGVTAAGTSHVHPHPGVRYMPVSGAPPITVYLAWPVRPTHPSTADFLTLARAAVR
ncbi:LysR family transcriptional regulator [Streptomyces sp. NPDC018031]|uniref:LysR family transcriptional regulator n=1 Tax=Streptomyces sp. NPDC018031 TaxID=3365033 RepID=UPI0037B95DAD